MKKSVFTVCTILIAATAFAGCGKQASNGGTAVSGNAAELLTEVKTTQFFTDEKVADGDVEKILSAGINAPSAMNTQPWHFTAVTDKEVADKLADAMKTVLHRRQVCNRPKAHPKICPKCPKVRPKICRHLPKAAKAF